MRPVLRLVAITLLIGWAALPAAAQVVHESSAQSSARIEITKNKDGEAVVIMAARNARLVPYALYDGDRQLPRLATVTTDVKSRTDAEGVDPGSTVSVTVDDLSGAKAKRLASFSDPGSYGQVIASRYFASTLPGCCDAPQLHRVRDLETGRALFRSTGPDPLGSSAWAEAPNAKPAVLRWAAFDGSFEGDNAQGRLGRIVYGGPEGPISFVELRATLAEESFNDLWEGLAHNAVLLWRDPKAPADAGPPGSGEPGSPQPMWSADKLADAKRFGGFELLLMLDDKQVAAIPVIADRLVPTRATLPDKITLVPVAR